VLPEQINELIQQQPFTPLRLHLSNGSHIDIRHRELVLVTKSQVIIAEPTRDEDLPDKTYYSHPLHITHIETLTARKNGRKKRAT